MSLHPEYSFGEKITLAHPIKAAQQKCEGQGKTGGEKNCFLNDPNKKPNQETLLPYETNSNKKDFLLIEVTGAPAKSNNHRQPGLYFVSNMEDIKKKDTKTYDLIGVQSVLYGGCLLRDTSGNNNRWRESLDNANCLFNISSDAKVYHSIGFVEDRFLTNNNQSINGEENWFINAHKATTPLWQKPLDTWLWIDKIETLLSKNPADLSQRFYLENPCKKTFDTNKMLRDYVRLSVDKINQYISYECTHNGYFFNHLADEIDSLPKGWQIYQASVVSALTLIAMTTAIVAFGPVLLPALEAAGIGISAMAGGFTEGLVSFLGASSEFASLANITIAEATSTSLSLLAGPGLAVAFVVKDSFNYSKCTTDHCKSSAAVSMAIDLAFLGFTAKSFELKELPKITDDTDGLIAEKNNKVKSILAKIVEDEGGGCLGLARSTRCPPKFDLSSYQEAESGRSGNDVYISTQKNRVFKLFGMNSKDFAREVDETTTAQFEGLDTTFIRSHEGQDFILPGSKSGRYNAMEMRFRSGTTYQLAKRGQISAFINKIGNMETSELKTLRRIFAKADAIGMRDPQFIFNLDDPNVYFIDVHLQGTPGSGQCSEIVDRIDSILELRKD